LWSLIVFNDFDHSLRAGSRSAPGQVFHAGGNIDLLCRYIAIIVERKQLWGYGPTPRIAYASRFIYADFHI
jgi:hypothetical protein